MLDQEMLKNGRSRCHGDVPSRKGIDVELLDDSGGIYLVQDYPSLFSSKHQFCAILPLDAGAYQKLRRSSKRSSIFGALEKLLDLDSLYHTIGRECIPQMTVDLDEESGEADESESQRGNRAEDETSSGETEDQGTDYVEESDHDVEERGEEEGEPEEEEEEVEEEKEEEEEEGEEDDDDDGDEKAETDLSEQWDRYLELFHTAWKHHKWPSGMRQSRIFDQIALRMDNPAKFKIHKKTDLDKICKKTDVDSICAGQNDLPIDCMTPVREFRKSFMLIERREEQRRKQAPPLTGRDPTAHKHKNHHRKHDIGETEESTLVEEDSSDVDDRVSKKKQKDNRAIISKLDRNFKSLGV